MKKLKIIKTQELKYNPYPSLCMGCGEHIYYCVCKKDKK